MEVKVKLGTVTIRDEDTGKEFSVRTLRTAEEIAGYVEESEKEIIVGRLEDAVYKAYARDAKDA